LFNGPARGLFGDVAKANHSMDLAHRNGYNFTEPFEAMYRARRTPTAFHLPEVCRQIYVKTATLAYKHNTFKLGIHDREWLRGLLPAQRKRVMFN
jgi:hypothetical protein